jgi:arginase family enzyme
MCAQRYIGSSAFESLGHPIRYVVESVASGIIGLDVNEIAAAFDGGQRASLGAKLILEFIAAKAAANR